MKPIICWLAYQARHVKDGDHALCRCCSSQHMLCLTMPMPYHYAIRLFRMVQARRGCTIMDILCRLGCRLKTT